MAGWPATLFAVLVNPTFPGSEFQARAVQAAAKTLSIQVDVVRASTGQDLDANFLSLSERRIQRLVVVTDPFFNTRQEQLANLAIRYAIPTIYHNHEFIAAGGLAGYGNSSTDLWRQIGVYAGRILKGEKAARLTSRAADQVRISHKPQDGKSPEPDDIAFTD